jgi:hypothetical protein
VLSTSDLMLKVREGQMPKINRSLYFHDRSGEFCQLAKKRGGAEHSATSVLALLVVVAIAAAATP